MRLGLLRIQQRRYDEAIHELKTAVELAERSTETLAALATGYAASGDITNAKTILNELEKPAAKRYVLPLNIAKIYVAMGDAEKAFMWLETSYKEGNPDLIELNSEPVFDGMRADPRFIELMRRVGWRV